MAHASISTYAITARLYINNKEVKALSAGKVELR
jgi:hypothetical protein